MMAGGLIKRLRDASRSSGTITVPPLDGPWTPNDVLESGQRIFASPDLVDVVPLGGQRLAVLTHTTVVLLHSGTGETLASTQLSGRGTAFCLASGVLLVALEGNGICALDPTHLQPRPTPSYAQGMPARCVTAMTEAPDGSVWIAQGAVDRSIDDWKRDLLTRGSSGSVWRAVGSTCERVALGLGWPAGLYVDRDQTIVSEAWKHRLVRIDDGGRLTVVLEDLPAYPSHLSRSDREDGFALACALPRSSLVEFVINEKDFVAAMINELDERAWVVPQLATLRHPLEQVQGGELLVFGQVKPWAPTRSYGLAVLLDSGLQPLESLHSRANGRRHGVSRVLLDGDDVVVVAQGGGDVSRVHLPRRTHVTL